MSVSSCSLCTRPIRCKGLCARHYAASRPKNKEYEAARQKNWVKAQPESRRRIRQRHAAKRTGQTPERIVNLRELQEGRCGICSRPMSQGNAGHDRECADHDHETGLPRALLCTACNTCLGFYEKHTRSDGFRIDVYDLYLSRWMER